MFHSVAVVGVNTSALIESGIVGRPVYTVLADEFAGQQEGTLHFQHLKNVNGGLLHGCGVAGGARRAAGDAVRYAASTTRRSRGRSSRRSCGRTGSTSPPRTGLSRPWKREATERPAPRRTATDSVRPCCCRSWRPWRWPLASRSAVAAHRRQRPMPRPRHVVR